MRRALLTLVTGTAVVAAGCAVASFPGPGGSIAGHSLPATAKGSRAESADPGRAAGERRDSMHALEELRSEGSIDGASWRDAGIRLLQAGELEASITAFRRAVDLLGYRGELAMYNLACAYSLEGNREEAMSWLKRAVDSGYDNVAKLTSDPDIALLRPDARYQEVAESARTLSMQRFFTRRATFAQPGKQWDEAVALYTVVVQQKPESGRAWFNLGYSLHYSGHPAEAIAAFQKALDLGYRPPVAMYNIACAYSRIDNRENAFRWLEKAADAGFSLATFMPGDPDMENLRSDPRFEKLAEIGATGWA